MPQEAVPVVCAMACEPAAPMPGIPGIPGMDGMASMPCTCPACVPGTRWASPACTATSYARAAAAEPGSPPQSSWAAHCRTEAVPSGALPDGWSADCAVVKQMCRAVWTATVSPATVVRRRSLAPKAQPTAPTAAVAAARAHQGTGAPDIRT